MNMIDAVVTEVKGSPYKHYDKWWVNVECEAYGVFSDTAIMFSTFEEAAKVGVGYEFLI